MASNTISAAQLEPHPASRQDVEQSSRTIDTDRKSGDKVDAPIEHAEVGLKDTSDSEGRLPAREEALEQLGIPNWRELEKKIVRRLDMTLLPTLWILYVFNYLDRASLGYGLPPLQLLSRHLVKLKVGNKLMHRVVDKLD